MQCRLNGVHNNEVVETLSERTHAIELVDPFDATHPLINLLKLSCVTSYFDVFSSSIA